MKTSTVVIALCAASASANVLPRQNRPSACNADNCARSVTGTAMTVPNLASRRADCSSFLSTTVTPATFTPTITTASTSVTTSVLTVGATTTTTTVLYVFPDAKRSGNLEARIVVAPPVNTPVTQTPTNVPAYASPCSGTARYSSACACWTAVTRGTTTVPTPTAAAVTTFTTTTVVTETSISNVAVATSTVTACSPANSFDYKYALTNGQGADLTANNIGSGDTTDYQCCSACYLGPLSANCAGTVINRSNGQCTVYTTSGGVNANDECPGGLATTADVPGNEVALAACGRTRPA